MHHCKRVSIWVISTVNILNFFLTPIKSQRETYARLYELLYIEFVHRALNIVVIHVKPEVIWKRTLVLDWCQGKNIFGYYIVQLSPQSSSFVHKLRQSFVWSNAASSLEIPLFLCYKILNYDAFILLKIMCRISVAVIAIIHGCDGGCNKGPLC